MNNDSDLPQDKKGIENFLKAKKRQLITIAEKIANNELSSLSQVNVYVWNEIQAIDEALDE